MMTFQTAENLDEDVRCLLSDAGICSGGVSIAHLETGGNNTLYQVRTTDEVYVLKLYKMEAADKRDRLGAEWNFLSLLNAEIPDAPVPSALAINREKGLGLFSFIEGEKVDSVNLSDWQLNRACAFIRAINSSAVRKKAGFLEMASEAVFSAEDHLEVLYDRIARLRQGADLNDDLCALLDDMSLWSEALGNIWKRNGLEGELPPAERCISPSDFGFHNALAIEAQKAVVFIDFEYAGWDDPAKLVADFFFQPQAPVDEQYYPLFLKSAISHICQERRAFHEKRAELLRPVFGLKWCCIVLNPFLRSWVQNNESRYINEEKLVEIRSKRLKTAYDLLERSCTMIERMAM